jgi:hypothetical protein
MNAKTNFIAQTTQPLSKAEQDRQFLCGYHLAFETSSKKKKWHLVDLPAPGQIQSPFSILPISFPKDPYFAFSLNIF